jgi:hypothetical protein
MPLWRPRRRPDSLHILFREPKPLESDSFCVEIGNRFLNVGNFLMAALSE